MKSKRYEDKGGNKVILTKNKSGGFYIKVNYSDNCSGGFGITKQDFEAMKEMDALVSNEVIENE